MPFIQGTFCPYKSSDVQQSNVNQVADQVVISTGKILYIMFS